MIGGSWTNGAQRSGELRDRAATNRGRRTSYEDVTEVPVRGADRNGESSHDELTDVAPLRRWTARVAVDAKQLHPIQ